MKAFKKRWDITDNWQLIYPAIGILLLYYTALKIALAILKNQHFVFQCVLSFVIYFLLLKFILFTFEKVKNKWQITQQWELISIYCVFAITGTASLFIGKPIIKYIGITKENLHPALYWVLFVIISLFFYKTCLIIIGWIFGQHAFFIKFNKKILNRFVSIFKKNNT